MTTDASRPSSSFQDPLAVASYADRAKRLVPGWADLQTMATLLIAERVSERARVLVIGAGGGVELSVFAQAHAQWSFVGVDPSQPMLDMAKVTLGSMASRVHFHHGYVDTAAAGPFDAASCLLTMHFLPREERLATLKEIRRRLTPGAPFVMAHLSFPQEPEERDIWLGRYAAFAIASGVAADDARRAATAIGARLPLLGPEEEAHLLTDAGFHTVRMFYAGLAFRGWVALA